MKKTFLTNVYRKTLYMLLISILSIGSLLADEGDFGPDVVNTLSDSEWKALNIFLSNFSETDMNFFHGKNYNDLDLIRFAIRHNVLNNSSRFKDDKDTGETYLPERYVNGTIKKYFGIDKIVPQQDPDDFFGYNNGKYFYYDVFEGSPWFTGSQVIELYDNYDGTFFAIIEVYKDNDKFQQNPNYMTPAFYEPKKNWKPITSERCQLSGYHVARIEKHEYEGKQIYKLLELQNTNKLEEARERMKLLISWEESSVGNGTQNIIVSPDQSIFVVEEGSGIRPDMFFVVYSPEGKIAEFAGLKGSLSWVDPYAFVFTKIEGGIREGSFMNLAYGLYLSAVMYDTDEKKEIPLKKATGTQNYYLSAIADDEESVIIIEESVVSEEDWAAPDKIKHTELKVMIP